jgi:hypothetical protein
VTEPAAFLPVNRVLGAGPFVEIGHPTAVATSGDLIAVGGTLGHPQWSARDVASRSRPHAGWEPVGVYRAADLACLNVITTDWPVNAVAFHPTLPLLAIGTGSYDGGYAYEGELLLLDLRSWQVTSVLEAHREVVSLAWDDEWTLGIAVMPRTDEEPEEPLLLTARRPDWDAPRAKMITIPDSMPVAPTTEPVDARVVVEGLCRDRGVHWAPRRRVWAVHALADGSVLAASEGVALERWAPGADRPTWSVPGAVGCQIKVAPDERTALVNVQPRNWDGPGTIKTVDLGTGVVTSEHDLGFSAVLVDRADGVCAARDTGLDRDRDHFTVVLGRAGEPLNFLGYDLFNHYFDIRRAPDLLFLQGNPAEPWRRKQVVTDERHLFPLEWNEVRQAHLFGGCGVYLPDGPAIIHTGAVHDGRGLLPGNAFVVRRAYPSGAVEWVFTADCTATAVDADDEIAYIAFNDGEVVALRTADGAVVGRRQLGVVPLSLTLAGPGRLVIGTLDGRLLDCSTEPAQNPRTAPHNGSGSTTS